MARWQPAPIVGGAYSDDSKPWSAQDCVNFIVTPAERGGTRSPGKLTCLPGYTTFCATMQEAPVRGLHDVEGLLLAVTGDTLYRIGTDGAATPIGTIPGVGRVSMAHNQITYGHEVMIANGQSGYVYNTYTGAFGQVTDDGFPGFTVVDFVDGYIAGVEPQGRFWAHSMLRQAGSYNTLDRYDAESAPDRMVSLIVSHREVMALNQRSAGFYRNTGATTGTFQNSNGTEIEVGCASPFAVARLDNTVYWLGNDGTVYRLAGHSPQRVSTGPIEQAISRCDMSKAFAFTFEDRGHKVFYLTFPDGQTWGYDVWTNEWHRRQSKDLNRWRIDALVKWNGVWIAGDFSNGRLYQLDWAVQHEAGEEMERRRISAVLHDNGNRVTVNAVKIEVDTGLASVPDPILSPLSVSGDLPGGFVGDSGTYQYTVSGGVLPHGDFTIASGSLPPGATMDADGLVTYEYTLAGEYSWTVSVTDAAGTVATVDDTAGVSIGTLLITGNSISEDGPHAAWSDEFFGWNTIDPDAGTPGSITPIAYTEGKWAACSKNAAWHSEDRINWFAGTAPNVGSQATVLEGGGGVLICAGSGGILFRSADGGATFQDILASSGMGTAASYVQDVTYSSGRFIMSTAYQSGQVWVSDDLGLTYAFKGEPLGTPFNASAYGVAHGNGLVVVVGGYVSGSRCRYAISEDNADTFGAVQYLAVAVEARKIAFGRGMWVIVCGNGTVAVSTDDWETHTLYPAALPAAIPDDLIYDGRRFWCCGASFGLYWSDDGATWSGPVTTGIKINDVRHIASDYVA